MIYHKLRPCISPVTDKEVILVEDFHYMCPKYGISVFIKKGFIFDGASTPRILWSTTGSPFMPQFIGPSGVHDDLYKNPTSASGDAITRKRADQIFKHALHLNGVGWYQRNKMYRAVRMFGMFAWNKHRKNDKK